MLCRYRTLSLTSLSQSGVAPSGSMALTLLSMHVAFLKGRGTHVYLDVVVPTAETTNPLTACSRAARDGAAAARAEDGKRVRHPGPGLIHVEGLEALGQPGRDASAFLQSLAPSDPETRSAVLGSAWQSLFGLAGRGCRTGPLGRWGGWTLDVAKWGLLGVWHCRANCAVSGTSGSACRCHGPSWRC